MWTCTGRHRGSFVINFSHICRWGPELATKSFAQWMTFDLSLYFPFSEVQR